MKEKLSQMAFKAGQAVSAAASKTADYVQTHKPTEQDLAQAKAMAIKAGKAVADETVALGKEVAQSKTFKDAAKGAGVGAVAAIPIPIIGPAVGAVIGAGAGIYLGSRSHPQAQPQSLPPSPPQAVLIDVEAAPPKGLYTELLKLGELREKGLLTNEEFEVQKQKLLQRV
jgi:hypothetical protein